MSGDMVTIKAKDGSGDFQAYVSRPKGADAPVIVMIQEIFGVNKGMREICHMANDRGFMAVCPDLFWRQEPGIQLTDQSEAEWKRAFQLYQGFDVDKGMEDIQATIDYARGADGSTGKVGAMGYCLGGMLAYLSACRTDTDASVGYYGVGIQDQLAEAANIKKPLVLHIAMEDEYVDKAAQKQLHEGLDPHPLVTLYDYAGCDHGFARPGGVHEDKQAAEEANARTFNFFANTLG